MLAPFKSIDTIERLRSSLLPLHSRANLHLARADKEVVEVLHHLLAVLEDIIISLVPNTLNEANRDHLPYCCNLQAAAQPSPRIKELLNSSRHGPNQSNQPNEVIRHCICNIHNEEGDDQWSSHFFQTCNTSQS